MTRSIPAVILEADDVAETESFLKALGVDDRVRVRPAQEPASGFRGYSLSLVVSQPGVVDAYLRAALDAGGTQVKAASKSFWGYGGSFRAPDGTVWTVASSKKKDSGPSNLQYDELVLLLGVDDVKATRQLYVEQGLEVGKGFGSKYVEFKAPTGPGVKLALQSRRAVAKNAGVDAEGSGSHRLAILSDGPPFTDPDGYEWESR